MSFGSPLPLRPFVASTSSQLPLQLPTSLIVNRPSASVSNSGIVPGRVFPSPGEIPTDTHRFFVPPGLNPNFARLPEPAFVPGGPVPPMELMRGFAAPFGCFPGPLPPELKSGAEMGFPGGAFPPSHPQALPGFYYDPGLAGFPFGAGPLDLNGARRKNATRETTAALKAWLYEHRKNPYPTKGEKIMLAIITKMTLTQVSTWFANARRRLKKDNKMTWSPRNRTGEEDDDDDDIGIGDDIPADRSNSSLSNRSALEGTVLSCTENEMEEKDKSQPSTCASHQTLENKTENCDNAAHSAKQLNGEVTTEEDSRKRATPAMSLQDLESHPPAPKKRKIWSIAETVGCDSSTSTNKDSKTPPVSIAFPTTPVESVTPTRPSQTEMNPWLSHGMSFGMIRHPMNFSGPDMRPPIALMPPNFGHLRPEAIFASRQGLLAPHPAILAAAGIHMNGSHGPFLNLPNSADISGAPKLVTTGASAVCSGVTSSK